MGLFFNNLFIIHQRYQNNRVYWDRSLIAFKTNQKFRDQNSMFVRKVSFKRVFQTFYILAQRVLKLLCLVEFSLVYYITIWNNREGSRRMKNETIFQLSWIQEIIFTPLFACISLISCRLVLLEAPIPIIIHLLTLWIEEVYEDIALFVYCA